MMTVIGIFMSGPVTRLMMNIDLLLRIKKIRPAYNKDGAIKNLSRNRETTYLYCKCQQ